MNPYIEFGNAIKTTFINTSTSPSSTLYTTGASQKCWVMEFYLQAEADVEVSILSNATAIIGLINFTTATSRERHWGGHGFPIFKTLVAGDDLNLYLSSAVQVNGWFTYMDMQ